MTGCGQPTATRTAAGVNAPAVTSVGFLAVLVFHIPFLHQIPPE